MYSKRMKLICVLLTLLPIPLGLLLGLRDMGLGFIEPISMALVLLLCMHMTEGEEKNKKVNQLVIWLLPILSNGCFFLSYALNQGLRFSVMRVMVGFFGLMMVVIGNYMPKCRQNPVIGIRISWTLESENNWNATHRMAGPLWVLLGAGILLSLPFSETVCMAAFFVGFALMVLVPTVYSYLFHRRELRAGTVRKGIASGKKWTRFGVVILLVVLTLTAVLLFTGSIHVEFRNEGIEVGATYYSVLTVPYASIRECEYRQEDAVGLRNFGLGSFRLLCGQFRNEEFGDYTRYTVYRPQGVVVLRTDTDTIVLSGNNQGETEELYQEILERCGK